MNGLFTSYFGRLPNERSFSLVTLADYQMKGFSQQLLWQTTKRNVLEHWLERETALCVHHE